jgi:hypothetical protein
MPLIHKRLPVKKLIGTEEFKNTGSKKISVVEFWRYGFSNLHSNTLRGVLAEFLVENALKEHEQITVRNPWGDWDVTTPTGGKVEVKCSAYIQDWDQHGYSRIVWSGLKAKSLYYSSAVSGIKRESTMDYKADAYVLALFKHKEQETLDILDLDQWCFWVLSKERIKEIAKTATAYHWRALKNAALNRFHFLDLGKQSGHR